VDEVGILLVVLGTLSILAAWSVFGPARSAKLNKRCNDFERREPAIDRSQEEMQVDSSGPTAAVLHYNDLTKPLTQDLTQSARSSRLVGPQPISHKDLLSSISEHNARVADYVRSHTSKSYDQEKSERNITASQWPHPPSLSSDLVQLSSQLVPRSQLNVPASMISARATCGLTSSCANYQKEFCPMRRSLYCYAPGSCPWFSPRTPNFRYGSHVNGHWRRGRNGKMSWVKAHTRTR
jgi:hypothetical protein